MPEERAILRMTRFQAVLFDLLQDLPCSSVEVERSHANMQTDHHSAPKRPSTVQADTYVAHAVLEHNLVSRHLELEIFGSKGKKKVRRVLQGRKVETTAPGNGLTMRRPHLTEEGTVRGRKGLLKGMLPLVGSQTKT